MRRKLQLNPGERIDELLRNGYGIIQSGKTFCFGMDAVLLSGFCQVREGETAVDLGTGTGIIPILLEAKTKGRYFIGIEIQPRMADMAARSVYLNGLEKKIRIIPGDLREIYGSTDNPALKELKKSLGKINVVTANPPYIGVGLGLENPDDSMAWARHEIKCTLRDICEAAGSLLIQGGRLYMVHRPARLPEIVCELKKHRLEPKKIKPVYPFIDKQANMILIEAIKDGGAECILEAPIIIYKEPGKYTDEIYEIYGY